MSRPGCLSPKVDPAPNSTPPAEVGHFVLVHLPFPCLAVLVSGRSDSDKLSQLVPSLLLPFGRLRSKTKCPGAYRRKDSTDVRGISGRDHHRRSVGTRCDWGGRRGRAADPEADILSQHAAPTLPPSAPTTGRIQTCGSVNPRLCSIRWKRHEQSGSPGWHGAGIASDGVRP
jgi:hypothetical protein